MRNTIYGTINFFLMETNSKIRKLHIQDVILSWILVIRKLIYMKVLAAFIVCILHEDVVVKELIVGIIIEFQLQRKEIRLIMLRMPSGDRGIQLIEKIWQGNINY